MRASPQKHFHVDAPISDSCNFTDFNLNEQTITKKKHLQNSKKESDRII